MDMRNGLGAQFGAEGMDRMCDLINFSTMKTYRLVCHSWNDCIVTHPRFQSARGILKLGWETGTSDFRWAQVPKHTEQAFTNIGKLQSSPQFTFYWKQNFGILKSLTLTSVRISCSNLADLLNACPRLTSVNLKATKFNLVQVLDFQLPQDLQPPPAPNGEEQPPPTFTLCCNHTGFEPKANCPLGPRTLKKITITDHKSFPLCLLDLFQKRSSGQLETLKVANNKPEMTGSTIYPTPFHTEPYLARLCEGSMETLKEFTWDKNGSSGILTTLAQDDLDFPALRKLNLGHEVARNRMWDDWGDDPNQPVDAFRAPLHNFLSSQIFHLEEMELECEFSHGILTELRELLPTIPGLRKLRIKTPDNWRRHRAVFDVFGDCDNLLELEIVDGRYGFNNQPFIANNRFNIHSGYLIHLPDSLRKLTLNHRVDGQIFPQALLSPTFTLLTKLVVGDGNSMTDANMQSIIVQLNVLEVLAVRYSHNLSDAGLTGLEKAACRELIRCQSHSLLLDEPLVANGRRTLSELTCLRELDFKGCSQISDISVCYAMRFPELRRLRMDACNVSDIGLISLGKHNPKLNELVIMRNRHVSHYGLNRLVRDSKSLQSIKTTEAAVKRTTSVKFAEHPQFKDVVTCPPPKPGDLDDWLRK